MGMGETGECCNDDTMALMKFLFGVADGTGALTDTGKSIHRLCSSSAVKCVRHALDRCNCARKGGLESAFKHELSQTSSVMAICQSGRSVGDA